MPQTWDEHGNVINAPPPTQAAQSWDANGNPIGSQPQQPASPTDAISKATGIGPGPGFFAQKWNDIKQGLLQSGEGSGLPRQPTALGNAAQFAGMVGREGMQLGIGPGMAEGAGMAAEAIPSAERAGKTFKELQGAIGTHTVAMTEKLSDALAEIKDAVDTGSNLPPVINKFVTRIANVEEGPLTYKEARQFYHNVSDLSASERMAAKGNDLRLINNFKHALGDTVAQTAQDAGRLDAYRSAMSEFHNAKALSEKLDTVKKVAARYAIPALIGAGGYAGLKTVGELMGR